MSHTFGRPSWKEVFAGYRAGRSEQGTRREVFLSCRFSLLAIFGARRRPTMLRSDTRDKSVYPEIYWFRLRAAAATKFGELRAEKASGTERLRRQVIVLGRAFLDQLDISGLQQ